MHATNGKCPWSTFVDIAPNDICRWQMNDYRRDWSRRGRTGRRTWCAGSAVAPPKDHTRKSIKWHQSDCALIKVWRCECFRPDERPPWQFWRDRRAETIITNERIVNYSPETRMETNSKLKTFPSQIQSESRVSLVGFRSIIEHAPADSVQFFLFVFICFS